MAGQTTLDAIVRAELAIEIMNQARGLVSERVAAIEANDPAGAEALRAKRRELLALTPADRDALKSGDLDRLSRNLAISPERAITLARVQSQMHGVHGLTQLHRQQLERGRNAAISIKR